MLTTILEILANKESLSLVQLAEKAGYTVREVEGFLDQLEHMGYIRRDQLGQACGISCDTDRCSSGCEGCGFRSMETFSFWVLTERGEHLVGSKLK